MKKHSWHKDIVYQIYPKSFNDTSGNGYGDINGIIEKLDYLEELGVTCLWLSPVFKSPMKDNGYDISDYRKIDPIFGSNEDMYNLISQARTKGIKIMLDLVVNHTSDQHFWFQEAIKGKDNPYRDYYIWRDNKNDLKSIFLGDAWTYDEKSKQYYFHMFAKEQPDLNWENPILRNEIYDMMNFWINHGAEGFRMDVIEFLGKEPENMITSDGKNLHEYIHEMNQQTFGKKDIITVGESWSATDETSKLYTNPNRKELSMIFRFDQITTFWDDKYGKWMTRDFDLLEYKNIIFSRQKKENHKYWNTLFLGSHDLPRSVSQYVDPSFRKVGAKMLFACNAFLSGTPFIYQGDEIGMTNLHFDIDEYKDIEAINAHNMLLDEGFDKDIVEKNILKSSRDNARTPMQWTDTLYAGFSDEKPWTKVNPNYTIINVTKEQNSKDSILAFYKKVIRLRKSEFNDLVLYGDFEALNREHKSILSYQRKQGEKVIKVYCNFSSQETQCSISGNIILNNYDTLDQNLKPYQVVVVKI